LSRIFSVIFLLVFALMNIASYSQDTTKKKIDTTYKTTEFILSDNKYHYINPTNPDTITRKRFLWYPLKNFEDVFNYLPGYYLNYMDVGQFNPVSYNQYNYYSSAVLRNGRPVNERGTGEVDFNLFSRNEIAEIELTNGFGNTIYSPSDAVNIVQRQIFQNRPYTEISFWQDRYENLYFDGNYHQNIFRNFNFNFGVTKHSYTGKYKNSDFDKWLGRFNLNFAVSSKLNFFAYVNYAKIQKGLNEGIIPDTVNLGVKDEVFDPVLAVVKNSDSYEKKERFDVDAGAVLLAGKNSVTKIQLFTSNSFRQYRDEENRPNSNGIYFAENYHWLNYGAKLQQVFNFSIAKKFEVISKTEGEYDSHSHQQDVNFADTSFSFRYNYDRYSYITDLQLAYKNINLEGYIKGYTANNFKYISNTFGTKIGYTLTFDSLKSLNLYGQYLLKDNYFGAGLSLKYGLHSFSAEAYQYGSKKYLFDNVYPYSVRIEDINLNGLNIKTKLRIYKFDLDIKFTANFKLNDGPVIYYPKYHGNADFSYHDIAFKNKLEFKIGLNTKAWSGYKAFFYDGLNNSFYNVIVGRYDHVMIPQNATLDFYIIGKIDKATFGITFENILNRVIYNTGVYPFTDRGGLANFISRFNITWNFLN